MADLLLHVVDAAIAGSVKNRLQSSTPYCEKSVREMCRQIQIWNKIDATLASPEVQRDAYGNISRVLLSALTGEGLDLLRQILTDVALTHKAALAAASQTPDSD
jgi:GTP-binding protein HflX